MSVNVNKDHLAVFAAALQRKPLDPIAAAGALIDYLPREVLSQGEEESAADTAFHASLHRHTSPAERRRIDEALLVEERRVKAGPPYPLRSLAGGRLLRREVAALRQWVTE